ncbi:MAG: hypothetical protein WC028_29640 [Candidatus Obscuribacterales bacterium]|jgi:hypothetical protein
MGDVGKEMRMASLRQSLEHQILDRFKAHEWVAEISDEGVDADYIVVTARKLDTVKRLAVLYSCATDNKIYKRLDAQVDRIFTNGALYHPEQYAHGISKPPVTIDEFHAILIAWNKDLCPVSATTPVKPKPTTVRRIKAENPLMGVWARLDQLSSTQLAEKLIKRRALEQEVELPVEVVKTKGEGLAFAMRSASDYFRSAQYESLNRKIISLYYGALALASAEILVSPNGPTDLDEIERYTTKGHGLYTWSSSDSGFADMLVGVLATGFLPKWTTFLGYDITGYPKSKPKVEQDLAKIPAGFFCTNRALFSMLPEIADLFAEAFGSEPSWINPVHDSASNMVFGLKKQEPSDCSYIKLFDESGQITLERIKAAKWPLAEISQLPDPSEGRAFRARVDHPGMRFWHEALPLHHSTFENSGALIFPVLANIAEYRVNAFCILYTLSIMVRYMPSTWRKVEDGDLDQYLTLVKTTLAVFERTLPQLFLESITDEQVLAVQPGSLFS